MTDKLARVLKFILDRKKPVTAKMVAQHFAVAQSTAAKYLRSLYEAKLITREQIGGQIVWAKKAGASVPVALPPEVVVRREPEPEPEPEPEVVEVRPSQPAPAKWEQPKVIWPTSTFKTSYPHIRGYDD